MKNLYSDTEASRCGSDLSLRVYTSNLLGRSDDLVLHGGGNTSVKISENGEEILYVKGSGWDLVSIKEEGFAPVRLQRLLEMAQRTSLGDSEMVARQKAAMTDPSAPNPSVEAILHALIPYRFVDHTHADAVVTISNSKNGEALIGELFPGFLIVPYVMPGFILARTVYEMTRDFDWQACRGIILHRHGIFTFDDDAKRSYARMIDAVTTAERFLDENAPLQTDSVCAPRPFSTEKLAEAVARAKGCEVVPKVDRSDLARHYSCQKELRTFATRGVLTPEHILRTKRMPLVLEEGDDIETAVADYVTAYEAYFNRYATDETMLDPAPNYAVVRGVGIVLLGRSEKESEVMGDIVTHTMRAVLRADGLGGYRSIGERESFEMEYWELEQAKLKKQG